MLIDFTAAAAASPEATVVMATTKKSLTTVDFRDKERNKRYFNIFFDKAVFVLTCAVSDFFNVMCPFMTWVTMVLHNFLCFVLHSKFCLFAFAPKHSSGSNSHGLAE